MDLMYLKLMNTFCMFLLINLHLLITCIGSFQVSYFNHPINDEATKSWGLWSQDISIHGKNCSYNYFCWFVCL